jgi:hypothetical protein
MLVSVILGSVAVTGAAFAWGLLVVIIGIRRAEHFRRLTGRPGSVSEALARRLLVGSRGHDSSHDAGDGR